MRTMSCGLLTFFLACGAASAQTPGDLQIRLGIFQLSPDGGEKPGGGWYVSRANIGKPANSTFSLGETCDAWQISGGTSVREGATTAWKIETTPIRVDGNAVTFRLRWVRLVGLRQQLEELGRAFEEQKARITGTPASRLAAAESSLPGEDIELTLRPGESWPLDTVRVPPGAKTVHGKPCGPTVSIRASVDYYPGPEDERRLVVADLWLIERMPDGTEVQRSQPLVVRGLPLRPFRFYFDSIVDGNATLDVYGILAATLESDAMAVSVETRSRWAPETRNISGPQGFFKSDIRVTPSETVEIRLPLLGDGPFAKRALSIRIRARQLR